MKTYNATFHGKLKGAIGISYWHETTVTGENKEEANLNLYKTHDHIAALKLNEVK